MKRLAILGSTGSIGDSTLALVRAYPDRFQVAALCAGKNLDRLRSQIREFRPAWVSVQSPDDSRLLAGEFPDVKVLCGEDGLNACATLPDVDCVVVGIVGFAALAPTLKAIRAGKTLALANKESLVVAGSLLRKEILQYRAQCIPVDSEHNALFQLLEGKDRASIQSLVLTASGGPFFRRPDLPWDDVTPAMAVQHPNWKMGPKISVDSATLMNKGLELVEAHFLFDFPLSRIEVWVHPQSIVHGAIWFEDHSCMAQLTKPDMKSSIGFALAYPERLPQPIAKLGLNELARLEFYEPDHQRFPSLGLARHALEAGPSHLVVLNAANELAVQGFLEGRLLFSQIMPLVEKALESHQAQAADSLPAIFQLDAEARVAVSSLLTSFEKR